MSKPSANGTPEPDLPSVWEFHDRMIPARLFMMLRDQDINHTDLLLIAVVSGLTKHTDDGKGRGCFASNDYLAAAVGRGPGSYISTRIKHLRLLGLLLVIEIDGRRYLETEWARTAEQRAGMKGAYGKELRAAYDRLWRRLKRDAEAAKKSGGALCKTISPLMEKHKPPYGKTYPIEEEENEAEKNPHPTDGTSPSGCGDKPSLLNGHARSQPSPARQLAQELHDGLAKQGKLMRRGFSSKAWAVEFAALLADVPVGEVRRAIADHIDNLADQYWPKLYSAKSFCREFPRVQDARKRLGLILPDDTVPMKIPQEVIVNGKKHIRYVTNPAYRGDGS